MLDKINKYWIVFTFIALTIGCILMTFTKSFSLIKYSYILYGSGIISLGLIFINFIKGKEKVIISDILIILMIINGVIVTLFCKYKLTSFYGSAWRRDGLLSVISLYLLLFLASMQKKESKPFIIWTFINIGIFQVIIGLLQIFHIIKIDGFRYSMGLFGHSNFYGAFVVMIFSLCFSLLIFTKEKKYIAPSLIMLLGVISSGCMSSYVSCFIILMIFLIIKFKKIKKKYLIIGIVFILISSFIIDIVSNNKISKDIKEISTETYEMIVNKRIDESYGTNRIFIWKYSLSIVPKYLFKGAGFDCLKYVFPQEKNHLKDYKFVDKAHNEFIDMLICEGIYTPVLYITILFIGLKSAFKSKDKTLISVSFAVLAYLLQSFFTFRVIVVAPFYFVMIGLCYDRKKIYDNYLKKKGF